MYKPKRGSSLNFNFKIKCSTSVATDNNLRSFSPNSVSSPEMSVLLSFSRWLLGSSTSSVAVPPSPLYKFMFHSEGQEANTWLQYGLLTSIIFFFA